MASSDPDRFPRGAALMDLILARITDGDPGELDNDNRRPMDPAVLAELRFPDGTPLPPSLRRWLAFDATCLFEMIEDPDQPAFRGGTLAQFVEWTYAEHPQFRCNPDPAGLLATLERPPVTGKLWMIGWGDEDRVARYVGHPDEHGEYPVVRVTDGGFSVRLEAPGFDAYLAEVGYLSHEASSDFPASMRDQERRHPELDR
jgi:hypothetical protein